MKTREYKVYQFKELSEEAKENAIRIWYESEDYPFLSDDLTESCKTLLEGNKIQYNNDLNLGYSLSCCQGDGLNFTGNFQWKKYDIKITHSWRYPFASSSDISIVNEEGEDIENVKIREQFKNIYLNICNELEKEGYGILEYRMNDEEFTELCEWNDYWFLDNGKMD